MNHKQYDEIKKIIEAGIAVHLVGPSGSGKSTIIKQVAKDLGLEYYYIGCTRQTTEGKFIGFNSVATLEYMSTLFRKAVEFGGIFSLEELNGIDPNTVLVLNSLDNGSMAFPDRIVEVHKDFRLVATSNPPSDEHGAMDELDFSTKNRFQEIWLDKDDKLCEELSSSEAMAEVEALRKLLEDNGSSKKLTMRDEMRLEKLKALGIKNPLLKLIDTESEELKSSISDKIEEGTKRVLEEQKARLQAALEEKKRLQEEAELAKLTQHDMQDLESYINKIKENK